MGAGRGKGKRVRAAAQAGERKAVFDVNPWNAFVRTQKLQNVRLAEYYGLSLDVSKKDAATWRKQEKLAEELLRDLVSVGAIKLPSKVGVEHFGFLIEKRQRSQYSNYRPETLFLFLHPHRPGSKMEKSVCLYPGEYLNDRVPMDSYKAGQAVRAVGRAAQELMHVAVRP